MTRSRASVAQPAASQPAASQPPALDPPAAPAVVGLPGPSPAVPPGPDVQGILQHAVDEAVRLVGADGALIGLLGPDGRLRFAYESGLSESRVQRWRSTLESATGASGGLIAAAIRTASVTRSDDYLADPAFEHSARGDELVREMGIRSLVAAPLIVGDHAVGALAIHAERPSVFSERDVAVVLALAGHAAAAIAMADLIERLAASEAALARRVDIQRSLSTVGAALASLHDPGAVLRSTVDVAVRLLGADGALLDLVDPATGRIAWAYDAGLEDERSRELLRALELEAGEGLFGRAIGSRQVTVTGDYLADTSFVHADGSDAFVRRQRIRSMIAAPLFDERGPIGVIGVYTSRPDAFGLDEITLAGSFASQATIAVRNARFIDELDRSRAELARRADAEHTLRELAARLTTIHAPADVLQRVVDEAARLLDASGAILELVDPKDQLLLRWAYDAGVSGRFDPRFVRELTLPIGVGLTGRAVAEGRVLIADDHLVAEFPRSIESDRFFETTGYRSMLAAPILAEAGPLGALEVYSIRPHAFGERDADLIQAFADQAAIAIGNARLIDELDASRRAHARLAEQERALRQISARITALRDPDEVLQLVVEEARRLIGSDGAHLALLAEDRSHLRPVAAAGVDDETRRWILDLVFPLHGGLNGLAASLGRPIRSDDYLVDPRIPHEDQDQYVAARLGLRGVAVVPLRAPAGEIVGTLAVSFRTVHEVDDDRVDLLQVLGDLAAVAVSNARLDALLRRSEVRYRHLVENSPDLVWAIDEDARFTFLSDTCERLTGWRPDELLGGHFGGLVHPSSGEVAEIDWAAGLADGNNEIRGRVNLLHSDGHAIPAEFVAVSRVVAGRFAGANGSVRDMSERDRLEGDLRRQAGELAARDERAHLARELHDSVTQALFSMTLLTRSVELLLTKDPAAAGERLKTLRDLQRDALAEMRALIFELRPGGLEQDGLIDALRRQAAAVQGRAGLPVAVEAELDQRLPADVEDCLYRIGQEALHNVVKHAGARSVRLHVARAADEVWLTVVDDGAGFDADAVPPGHLGLAGMRARAERIGGRFRVDSGAGRGTTIEVVVPVPPAA